MQENLDLLAPLEPSENPIAVIVCHGIGQQAQFETLNDVVDAFELAHKAEWEAQLHTSPKTDKQALANIDFFPTEGTPDELLPLAQIEFKRLSDGRKQTFHFFEIYWAPL